MTTYVRSRYQIAEDHSGVPETTERLTIEQLTSIYGEANVKSILVEIDSKGSAIRPDLRTQEAWPGGPPKVVPENDEYHQALADVQARLRKRQFRAGDVMMKRWFALLKEGKTYEDIQNDKIVRHYSERYFEAQACCDEVFLMLVDN